MQTQFNETEINGTFTTGVRRVTCRRQKVLVKINEGMANRLTGGPQDMRILQVMSHFCKKFHSKFEELD